MVSTSLKVLYVVRVPYFSQHLLYCKVLYIKVSWPLLALENSVDKGGLTEGIQFEEW